LAAKIRWYTTSYQAEPAEWGVTGEGLASPSGGGGHPWRLILSWLGGLLLWSEWLWGLLPEMVGGGLGGGCWIPGRQGGWDRPVGHLGGRPSGRGL